jgi:hypothetical protein
MLIFFVIWKVQFWKPLTDFHMFGPMKEALRGRRFSSNEEVSSAEQNLLNTKQKKKLFSYVIKKLVKRWNRCFEVQGGLRGKVTLVSFLYIYNKCAFFKSLHFLTYTRIRVN